MTQPETIEKLRLTFAGVEKTASDFSEKKFFQRPIPDKWSAAENVQHLFMSAKPLVSLFGKPELMLHQWGNSNRASMKYDEVVAVYLSKIGQVGAGVPAFTPSEVTETQTELIGNLHSVHSKFLERASYLPENILDDYQIPHPLIGLLTVKEFMYFTDYHTKRHNDTMKGLLRILTF